LETYLVEVVVGGWIDVVGLNLAGFGNGNLAGFGNGNLAGFGNGNLAGFGNLPDCGWIGKLTINLIK